MGCVEIEAAKKVFAQWGYSNIPSTIIYKAFEAAKRVSALQEGKRIAQEILDGK